MRDPGERRDQPTTPTPGPSPAALTPFLTPGVELVLAALTFFCALVLILATPGLQSAIFAALDAVFGRPDLPAEQLRQAHGVVLTPLATLLAALLYRLLGDRIDAIDGMPPAAIPFPPPPAGPLVTTRELALHLALAVAGSWVLSVLMHLLGVPVSEQTLVLELTASGDLRRPELAILAFSALALAPLAEELFFRGQLLRRTWRRGGPRAAYFASALLFAALHGNLHGFIVYLWLALVFGSAYARTGRLSTAIAVHLGNNAITLALLLLAPPT